MKENVSGCFFEQSVCSLQPLSPAEDRFSWPY